MAHQVGQSKTHHHGGKTTSNKSFPSLLGAELDELGSANEKAKDIGHDIIDDDHHDRHDEPDEALEHVLDDEIGLGDNTEKSHVCPSKERKLAQVIFLYQGEDKPDKP